jgi:hypothetical protein
MHRKLFISSGLALTAALVAAGIAIGSTGQLTKPETVHVVQTGGKITFLKENPNSNTFIGDEVVVNGPVFSADGHSQVGRQHALCTLMDKPGVLAECSITTFLRGGSIVANGVVHFGVNDRTRGAIIGGTGMFRNARGQVEFVNSTGNTEGFIFQLQP